MELLNLEGKSEIIQHLNKIDEICNNDETLLKSTRDLVKRVTKTIEWINKNYENIEITISVQLLEFLLYFSKSKDFTELFGDYRFSFLINNNLAYFIQEGWKHNVMNSRTSPNYKYIQNAITIIKEQRAELEKNNEVHFFDFLKYDFTLTKSYLQLAASFSHLKDHNRALYCGKKCILFLNGLLKNLDILVNNPRGNKQSTKSTQNQKDLKETFNSFMQDCKKINFFCGRYLDSILNEDKSLLETNEFKKFESVEVGCVENKLKPIWINKLSIINFMHIEYVFLNRLSLKISFDEIFSEGFLSILISLTCVIYFMISTENRFHFIINNKFRKTDSFKIKSVFEKNHYEKLKKMKNYVFSEFLHSKSICILQNYFEENSLLTHFTNSFLKNYQANLKLENIPEVEESLLNSSLRNTSQSIFEYSFDLSTCPPNINSKQPEKSQFSIFNTKLYHKNLSDEDSEPEEFDVVQNHIPFNSHNIEEKKEKKTSSIKKNINQKTNLNLIIANNFPQQEIKKSKKPLDDERITIKKFKIKFNNNKKFDPPKIIYQMKSEKKMDILSNQQHDSNLNRRKSNKKPEKKIILNPNKKIYLNEKKNIIKSPCIYQQTVKEEVSCGHQSDSEKPEMRSSKLIKNFLKNEGKHKNEDMKGVKGSKDPFKLKESLKLLEKKEISKKRDKKGDKNWEFSCDKSLKKSDEFFDKIIFQSKSKRNNRKNEKQRETKNKMIISFNKIENLSSTLTKKSRKNKFKKINTNHSEVYDVDKNQNERKKSLLSKIFKNNNLI